MTSIQPLVEVYYIRFVVGYSATMGPTLVKTTVYRGLWVKCRPAVGCKCDKT